MSEVEALVDLYNRAHKSLLGIIDHCKTITPADLARELEGFGYSTILLQLHHIVGAERYWLSVLKLATDSSEDESDWASLDAVIGFHDRVASDMRQFISGLNDHSLNAPLTCHDWRGDEKELIPRLVVLRTQTHLYQHIGQVTAMCRLLGSPVPRGLDFPLD